MPSAKLEKIAVVVFVHDRFSSAINCLESVDEALIWSESSIKKLVVLDGLSTKAQFELNVRKREAFKEVCIEQGWEVRDRCRNLGLKKNIETSLDLLSASFDKFFVVEDDLLVSKDFFDRGLSALSKWQVYCGSSFVKMPRSSLARLSFFNCWGWGAVSSIWQEFRRHDQRRIVSECLTDVEKSKLTADGSYPYDLMCHRFICDPSYQTWALPFYCFILLSNIRIGVSSHSVIDLGLSGCNRENKRLSATFCNFVTVNSDECIDEFYTSAFRRLYGPSRLGLLVLRLRQYMRSLL